jgi:hypothetical protein
LLGYDYGLIVRPVYICLQINPLAIWKVLDLELKHLEVRSFL